MLSDQRVSRILEALRKADRLRGTIVCDNDPEFTSKAMLKWPMVKGIKLNFIELGKTTQNAYIETFYGKFRQEYLRQHWFKTLHEPHESRGGLAVRPKPESTPQLTAISNPEGGCS